MPCINPLMRVAQWLLALIGLLAVVYTGFGLVPSP